MPETLLPDTSNPGPWHHYPASGKLLDQNELPVLQFTPHAGAAAKAIVIHSPQLMVRLQKMVYTTEAFLKSDLDNGYAPEIEKQLAASKHLLNLLAR